MGRLLNHWLKRKTKNYTQIPLFQMVFDFQKWKTDRNSKSCTFYAINPELAEDEFVKSHLCEVVDYIRSKYDMEILTKI